MTKWTAEKDAFSNGLIDTGITVFHVCDLTSEEETLRLLTDIAERHNADIDAITAERDRLAAELAAANATLDRLREVGIDPNYHGDPIDWEQKDQISTLREMQSILYPPETPND